MCYTRSLISYFFLGSLRISIFTLLEEIEDERVYPEIRFLFPLDRSDWVWGEVEEDAVYSLYFVCDTLGDFMENGIGNFLYSGGHGIFGI